MTVEKPDFQSDSEIAHVVKLNPDFQKVMRDDAQDILPGDALGVLPMLAHELEVELTISPDGIITYPPAIGAKRLRKSEI